MQAGLDPVVGVRNKLKKIFNIETDYLLLNKLDDRNSMRFHGCYKSYRIDSSSNL